MIEPIGLATLAVGFVCLYYGDHALAVALIVASVFGSAAAIIVGAANILPAHLLLGFGILSIFTRRAGTRAALHAMKPGEPGFWYLCLVVYGCISAFFLPRLFAGQTPIVPLGTSEYAETGSTVPLGPVSSNFTQSVYMVANLLCFCVIAAIASRPSGFRLAVTGLLVLCGANAVFALLDLATYMTGTQNVLGFMRNASYTFHHEEEMAGLKRIVGSFPEASSFARFTLGLLGFAGTLMLCGYRMKWTAPLAIASLLLVVLSTSSSGLAALVPLTAILYLTALMRCGTNMRSRYSSAAVLFAPQVVLAIGLFVMLDPFLSATVHHYVDVVVLSKSGTSSGVERSSWNVIAQQNLADTFGIGVGLGTIRTSSFVYALLAGVGIVGTFFYTAFIASLFLKRAGPARTDDADVRMACRNACLGLILGDLLVASSIDQGLLFSVFAAIACAVPETAPEEEVAFARPAGMRQAW